MKKWKIKLLKLGITQREFAQFCGLNEYVLSQYITGNRKPSEERKKLIDEKLKELSDAK